MTANTPDHGTDPLTFLATLRPDTRANAEWDHATSTAVLDRIVTTPRNSIDVPPGHERMRPARRGRWAVAGLVAAGAAAATVVSLVAPAGTPGGPDPAAAAELRRLAVVAGAHGAAPGADQYAYTAVVEEQTADDPSRPPLTGEVRVGDVDRRPRQDVWLSPSGVQYRKTGNEMCLRRNVVGDGNALSGNYAGLTGPQLAALPTEPARLAAFFDAHPAGDNRGTRNRFLSAGDLVRSGLATPPLRAAALRVLAVSDGVTVRTAGRDDRGRPATIASYRDGDSVESVYFDPATSAVLEEYQTYGADAHYSAIVLTSGVVDRLPDLPRCD